MQSGTNVQRKYVYGEPSFNQAEERKSATWYYPLQQFEVVAMTWVHDDVGVEPLRDLHRQTGPSLENRSILEN